MTTLDKRVTIHAPPERVFRFVERLERMPAWMPGAIRAEWEREPSRDAPGVLHEVLGLSDILLESYQEAARRTEPLGIGLKQVDGDFTRFETRIEVLPADRGEAILHVRVDLETPDALRGEAVDEQRIVHDLSCDLDHALLNAKEMVEAGRLP